MDHLDCEESVDDKATDKLCRVRPTTGQSNSRCFICFYSGTGQNFLVYKTMTDMVSVPVGGIIIQRQLCRTHLSVYLASR